jgi:hypothetical protein
MKFFDIKNTFFGSGFRDLLAGTGSKFNPSSKNSGSITLLATKKMEFSFHSIKVLFFYSFRFRMFTIGKSKYAQEYLTVYCANYWFF